MIAISITQLPGVKDSDLLMLSSKVLASIAASCEASFLWYVAIVPAHSGLHRAWQQVQFT